MRQIEYFGVQCARLLVGGKCVAHIGDNGLYSDPFFVGDRDYKAVIVGSRERVYFRTYAAAKSWLQDFASA